jgi:hypothetical protein
MSHLGCRWTTESSWMKSTTARCWEGRPISYIKFLYILHILHEWIASNEAVFLCRISRCSAIYFSSVNFSESPGRHRGAVASIWTSQSKGKGSNYSKIWVYINNDNDVSVSKLLITHYEIVLDFDIRQILHDMINNLWEHFELLKFLWLDAEWLLLLRFCFHFVIILL